MHPPKPEHARAHVDGDNGPRDLRVPQAPATCFRCAQSSSTVGFFLTPTRVSVHGWSVLPNALPWFGSPQRRDGGSIENAAIGQSAVTINSTWRLRLLRLIGTVFTLGPELARQTRLYETFKL